MTTPINQRRCDGRGDCGQNADEHVVAETRCGHTEECADAHEPLERDVEHAGKLGEKASDRGKQKGSGCDDRVF